MKKCFAAIVVVCLWAAPAMAIELVVNGQFSTPTPTTLGGGIPAWTCGGDVTPVVYDADGNPPPCAGLGRLTPIPDPGASGQSFSVSSLSQNIYIPRDAFPGTLTIQSQRVHGGYPFPEAYGEATLQGNSLFNIQPQGTPGLMPTPTPGWATYQQTINLSPYYGQTITLALNAYGTNDVTQSYVLLTIFLSATMVRLHRLQLPRLLLRLPGHQL